MATISLSNTLVLIPYAGGSQTVSITVSGSTLSNYEITAAGTLTITKNESSFSVLIGQNPNANSERLYTPTVTVNAADGTTASFPLYVIQKTQNITVADSAREKTYTANESTGYFFFISEKQYTGATYSKVFGDITFTGFRYDVSNTGCGTYFTMADNETNVVQQAVVVVSCNDGSSSDSAFVIMHKNGTDGSIAISPTEVTVAGSAGTRTFTVTSNQITSSSFDYHTWGDITFDSVAYNNDHTQITASWPANDSGETKVGYLSVIGEDTYGFTKTAYTTITQEPIPELEFTTDSRTLGYDESTAYYFISAVNVSNVTVSFSGDVSIDHHTLTATTGGYQLYVYTNNNTTTSMQTTTITVSGTGGGSTITDTATLYKKGTPGSISLNPDQVVRSYSSGSITSDIIASGVSNLQTSYWGAGGTTTITNVAMSNNTLTVTYGANNTGVRITNYASVTGEDQYGDTKRATITITQLGADPAINVTPATKTIAASATSTSYTVTTTEMDNTPTATSSADWISSLTINNGTLDVTLTGANTSTSPRTATITVSGRSPFGSLVTKQVTLTQKGEAGTLSISPTSYVTDGAAETKTFTVTSNGVSNIRATNTGDITFNSLNISGNTLTAVMSSNSTLSTRNGTIIVNGTDGNDDPISASATVEQRVIPTIEFGTSSRTLYATETTAYYPVRVYNVENPSVSISGNVSIDHYTFTQDQSDETLYTLYVYTNNNTSTNQLTSTITVSGQSELGTAASGTGTLIKLGVGGTITLNPNSVSVTEVAGTATSTITTSGITSSLTTEYWGDGGVTTVTNASISGSTLTVTYGANNTGSTVTNYVKVSGTDSNGNTQFATFVITQTGINPEISVYPPSKTVASTDVHTTFTIMHSGVSNLTMTTTALWITDYQINNGVLSVTFGTNSTSSQRSATLTVSGTTSLGTTVSDSVTLIQEAPQGEAGSITVNPDSRTLNPTEASCMYVVTYENISSALSVSVTGDVNITDYHLSEEDFGYYLWVTTADNTGTSDLTSTFTISGTDDLGVTRTATATLLKKAPAAGSITVEPWQRTVGYQAGSTTFTVTARNIVGNLTTEVVSTTTMSITSHSISNGTLTVAYAANTGAQKNAAIKISGTDTDGVEMWVLARLYQDQAPATYTFAFNPSGQSTKSISMSPTSVRYTIDSYKTIGSSYELGYDITNIEYTSGSWPTIINIRYEDGKPYILVPMNMTGSQRRAVIHFVQDESGREITSTLTQTSGGASTETFLPIWRDDVHTSSANDFVEYHISLGTDIIYAGKAYKYPEASNIEWTINDVCSNYIGTGITFTNGIQRIPNYCKTFSVVTNDQTLTDTKFYNSWAYDDTDYWLSDPIDYRVDPRQWLPVSFLSSNSRNITVGSTAYTASASDDGWTVMTNLNNLTLNCGGTFTVTPGIGRPRNYRVDCGDFALYYANAYGGWDALLVKGTTKKTDNIEHLNYRKKSRDLSEFSKVNYQNNITPTWSLNTGITINGQKMYHLLESTMVYLHNLNTNEIIPVVITNAQCEYLDYTNNGKKPYYYNITVEESNLKLRK